MKRRRMERRAAETVLPALHDLYAGAREVVRDIGNGPCARYRRERRRLFGIAYRAAKKAAR